MRKLKVIDNALSEQTGVEAATNGYFLTIEELIKLARDFQADCFDGFISNDKAYIESWLEKHNSL
jgi:hypothetical protein